MKKALALALVAAMTATMVLGCGGGNPAGSSAAPTQDAGSTAAPSADGSQAESQSASEDGLVLTTEPLEIELWDIASSEPKTTVEEGPVKAFMADYPNIHVNQVHMVNDTYKQDLIVAMSANKAPNMYTHWTGGPMNEYYKSGFCDTLDDLYDAYNQTDYLESALAMCRATDGKLIAMPYGGLSAAVVYYDKKTFADNGLEVPTTIEEFEAVCDKLLEAGITPIALGNGSKWTGSLIYMYLVARYGGPEAVVNAYFPENGGSFADEPFVKAAEKVQEWVKKGYIIEGCNSITSDSAGDRALIYNNTCAMLVHLSSTAGGVKSDMGEDWYNECFGAFQFPIDPESEKAGVNQKVAVGSAVGNAFSINSQGNEEIRKALFVLCNQYYTGEEYAMNTLEQVGKVVSINGMQDYITDPVVMASWDCFANATDVQLFYDQYLPASVAEVHKDTMSDLFGLTKTPEEICQTLQDAYTKYLAEQQ